MFNQALERYNRLVRHAAEYAKEKHKDTKRGGSGRSYFDSHLLDMEGYLKRLHATPVELAASFLHDTVEDTDATLNEIRTLFGDDVYEIVRLLTDTPEMMQLSFLDRKAAQATRIQAAMEHRYAYPVQLIKVVDQVSNIKGLLEDPPTDWSHKQILEYATGSSWVVEACVKINAGWLLAEYYGHHWALVERHS